MDRPLQQLGIEKSGGAPVLVSLARQRFDEKGIHNLRIVVSGGFDQQRVRTFEQMGVPIDVHGAGSAFLRRKIDVTADVVCVNGKPCAKIRRQFRPNPGLRKLNWSWLTPVHSSEYSMNDRESLNFARDALWNRDLS